MMGIRFFNMIAVGSFGMILSSAFSGVCENGQKRSRIVCMMALILLGQTLFVVTAGRQWLIYCYPFITHLPFVLFLHLSGVNSVWSLASVLIAYLCCQLRRWLALALVFLCLGGRNADYQRVAEIVVTIPLLLLILRLAAPSIRSLSEHTRLSQCLFAIIPAAGYGFDYVTRIYTDLFASGSAVAMEFMPFLCSVLYLVFVLRVSAEERKRLWMEQKQNILSVQMEQAVCEIDTMRRAGETMRIYRHDMRHHLQYLLSCIENGKLTQAAEHIRQLDAELETGKVMVYCKNETVNLIFSAFAERALQAGITMEVQADIPQAIILSENDLCVLLSNALENALQSCVRQKKDGRPARIEISAYCQDEKLFLQIVNSCDDSVRFANGIPVTKQQGHGFGVQSILAITEKYQGMCSFERKNDQFFLRLRL